MIDEKNVIENEDVEENYDNYDTDGKIRFAKNIAKKETKTDKEEDEYEDYKYDY